MGAIEDLRQGGFSEAEIREYVNGQRDTLRGAGFSDQEIDSELTGLKNPKQVPQPFLNRMEIAAEAGGMTIPAVEREPGTKVGKIPYIITGLGQGLVESALTLPSRMLGEADRLFKTGEYGTSPYSEEYATAAEQMPAAFEAAMYTIGTGLATPPKFGFGGKTVGPLPSAQDFTDATRAISDGNVPPETRQKIVDAYQNNGIHPAEIAANPEVINAPRPAAMSVEDRLRAEANLPPRPPPDGLPMPLSEMGKTGDPYIDAMLDNKVTKDVIDNAIVVNDVDVPYGAAGSVPTDNRLSFIDRHFPEWMESDGVRFRPRWGLVVHENVEQHLMEELTKAGVDNDTAWKVSHFYATQAEHAVYRKLGLDPAKVEALYKPILDQIQHFDLSGHEGPAPSLAPAKPGAIPPRVPTDMYLKPYPHLDVAAAAKEPTEPYVMPGIAEPPTEGELARARAILERIRNAVTPDGLLERYSGGEPPIPAKDGYGGMPPRQPPMGEPMLPPEPPKPAPFEPSPPKPGQPWFTYDTSPKWRQMARRALDAYYRTFQPELVSDAALRADPAFAEYVSRSRAARDQIIAQSEEDYQTIRNLSGADRQTVIDEWERPPRKQAEREGFVPEVAEKEARPAQTLADAQPVVERQKMLLESSYWREKGAGLQAGYIDEYLPHLFDDPERARIFLANKTQQVGPGWFQKERVFETIKDAQAAGLRLKSNNIVDLVTHRLISGADMIERMNLMNRLQDMNLARKVEDLETTPRSLRDSPSATELGWMGWEPVNMPDGKQYLIAPDIKPLWNNVMAAKGLWANEGAPGSLFRGWMKFKTAYAPLKLSLSLFHAAHVYHIDFNQHMNLAWRRLGSMDLDGALDSLKDAFRQGEIGKEARNAWEIPEAERTPEQKQLVQFMNEGGFIPQVSKELKIKAQRDLENAMDNFWGRSQDRSKFFLPFDAMRRGLEKMQGPLFERWIPNLKSQAFIREAQALMERHPEYWDNKEDRQLALREIAKSIDNRYGEMNYGSLFWNKSLKDLGVGTFLSLGWNLGFAREFGGGLLDPFISAAQKLRGTETHAQAVIRDARSRTGFAATYIGTAMLLNGIATYLLTGTKPEGYDYVFARIGGNNADGTPRRVTNMFYTREVPMAQKHIQEQDSIFGGLMDLLGNKLMFQPLKEMWQNKDYYGNEIYDPNGPVWQRAKQIMYHLGQDIIPISLTGAWQQYQTSRDAGEPWYRTAGEAVGAMIGFSPAPKYVEKTPIQNFITHQYDRYVKPELRPFEQAEKGKNLGDLRRQILYAQQKEDHQAVTQLSQRFLSGGGTRQGLSNILLHLGSDVTMFRNLPEAAQQAVMERASPEEQVRYKPWLKGNYTRRYADLLMQRTQAQQAGDDAKYDATAAQMNELIRSGIEDGHITDRAGFIRGVQEEMRMRYSPEISAIRALPKRLRPQFMQHR
jgi:hypothetical protein